MQPAESRRIRPVRMLMIIAFLGLVSVGLYYLILRMNAPATSDEQASAVDVDTSVAGFDFVSGDESGVIIHLKPTFIVNLAGVEGRYALRVQIRMQLDDRSLVDFLNENPAAYYRMIDRFLTTLKSKTYAELAVGDGMDRLKAELRDLANAQLPGEHVKRVIFHEVYFAELLPYATPRSS